MTTQRFTYQRDAVQNALEHDGLILNVGVNDDPGNLKACAPERVVNCDLFDYDAVMDRPNVVDKLFDCARDTWPFFDGEAALVVFGDILEHLTPDEIAHALAEARRVSRGLCITVPCDDRETTSNERADTMPRGAVHRTIVTEQLLRDALATAGWTVTDWQGVEYDDGTCWGKQVFGHFVAAT